MHGKIRTFLMRNVFGQEFPASSASVDRLLLSSMAINAPKQGDVTKIIKEQSCSYINAEVLYRPERGHSSCTEGQDTGDGGDCHGYCHF